MSLTCRAALLLVALVLLLTLSPRTYGDAPSFCSTNPKATYTPR